MVIGNGMIARRFRAFQNHGEVIIFASGVSNSKETQAEPYARERELVEQTLDSARGRMLVYFSTCSVKDPTEAGSPYVQHKLELEARIAERADRYLIVRASNVVGGSGNPHTVLNYFVGKVLSGEPFDLWKGATRNLIDLDDLFGIVLHYLTDPMSTNRLINAANPYSVSPLQIVKAIEAHTGRKARYQLIDKGQPFVIEATECGQILAAAGVDLQPEHYLRHLLQKYYS